VWRGRRGVGTGGEQLDLRTGGRHCSGPQFECRTCRVGGNAIVRNARIYGKVDCGVWKNITVTTDRRGECGRNGKVKILNLPDLPGINPANTETAE